MFELTDALARKIAFSMENQTEESVLVFENGIASIVPLSSFDKNSSAAEIASLPSWSSADGFNLLEEFVCSLRAENAKSVLGAALHSGRGVFKNFKSTLKNYPEIAQRFLRFKERKLKQRISEWYNSLREENGLSLLPFENEDSSLDDLVVEDFSFVYCDFLKDAESQAEVRAEYGRIAEEFKAEQGIFGEILSDIWRARNIFEDSPHGFVCRTLGGEFAGCAVFRISSKESPAVARESAALTTCFVKRDYRGLGIARKLISLCLDYFRPHKNNRVRDFAVADCLVPESLSRVFFDLGFEKTRSVYVASF